MYIGENGGSPPRQPPAACRARPSLIRVGWPPVELRTAAVASWQIPTPLIFSLPRLRLYSRQKSNTNTVVGTAVLRYTVNSRKVKTLK